MDLKQYRAKLVGDADERAVSPVIGVILMVALTVILAAVIAAFVMDLGDDMGGGGAPDAAVNADVSNSDEEVQLSVTQTSDDVDKFVLRGDVNSSVGDEYELELNNTGDTETLTSGNDTSVSPTEVLQESGTANIIAVSGDDESKAGSFEWDWE